MPGSTPATLECSVTGGAFAPCASPFAITNRPYNVSQNLRVRATDTAGNLGPIATTSWLPRDGLVLHYPWEQGNTHNTSLLAQRPAYSPDGPAAAQPFLGGWAGTALGSSVATHVYRGTAPALSSSATTGFYTASFWIRTNNDVGNGTLISTLGATGGLRVRLSGNALTVDVREGAQLFSTTVSVPMDRWASIALVATGVSKGLLIVVDGQSAGIVSAPSATGFDAGQAPDLTVGTFYNVAITGSQLCTVVARGYFGSLGACVPGSPGYELDFERGLAETGLWQLPVSTPRSSGFFTTNTGQGFRLPSTVPAWGLTGFKARSAAAPNHSLSLWFLENGSFGPLIDFVGPCVAGGPAACGIRINYTDNGLITFYAGTDAGVTVTRTYAVAASKLNSIVVTEQKTDPKFTDTLTIYINGVKAETLPIGAGDTFQDVNDGVALVQAASGTLDEVEFWQTDLSKDPEALCENGFDGEFDPATATCLLTAN